MVGQKSAATLAAKSKEGLGSSAAVYMNIRGVHT